MLLPASVLLRRADVVDVIGAALLAAAGGLGHRRVAELVGRPASTVRDWLRRTARVADRVLAVCAAVASGFGAEFVPPAPVSAGGAVSAVVEMLGALGRAAGWFPLAVAAGRGGDVGSATGLGRPGSGSGSGGSGQHQLALGGRYVSR